MCKIFGYAYLCATSLVAKCAKYLAMLISVPPFYCLKILTPTNLHLQLPLLLSGSRKVKHPGRSRCGPNRSHGNLNIFLVVQDISLLVQLPTKASLMY